MYAHSHGLEAMTNRGLVDSVEGIEDFLTGQLIWSVLPSDGVALLNAHAATIVDDLELIVQIDQLLWTLKLPSELRRASEQLGRRLLSETQSFEARQIHADYWTTVRRGESPGNGAVALAMIAQGANLSAEQALLVFCHGHAVSILGAAMRLLPVSHTDAQNILRRLHPTLAETVGKIQKRSWDEMTSFTPAMDIVSMSHGPDDVRMFAS